jgi:hypothetical protein
LLRIARTLLALLLAVWTAAVAALPPCAVEAVDDCCEAEQAGDGEARDGDAGDADHPRGCDLGCTACACCRPPVAPASTAAAFAPALAGARLEPAAGTLAVERAEAEIFQPPRA